MLTKLQTEMIIKIARHECTPVNGAIPECADDASTWADCVIETAQDKGVFTSLLNEKLVYHTGGKRDAAVGLTQAGFEEFLKADKGE